MTTPAEIVRGLTRVEKRVLLTAVTSTEAVMQRLADKGLYTFPGRRITLNGGNCKFVEVPDGFTDEGYAVRRVLEQERVDG